MPLKIRVKNVDKLRVEIEKNLNKIMQDKRMQSDLGEFAEKTNKADMGRGFNPRTGKKYKALKPSTVAQRNFMKTFNSTSDLFKAGKSNLHFSGQLKDSIYSRIKTKQSSLTISLDVKDNRKGYKNKDGTTQKTPSNSELTGFLKSMGRDVIGVFFNPKRVTQVKNIIRAAIRRRL